MLKKLQPEIVLLVIGYLAILYFPVFLHLDVLPLHPFDEARNAINAFEMSQNGHYLNRYFDGKLDDWVPKPPLLIWAQLICMKLIGYNELAVRLPIALCVLATVYLIVRFFHKEFNQLLAGLLAGLVLVCTNGYIHYHAARNGDHDVPLALILTAGVICFYKYLTYPEQRNKYLTYSAILIILGIYLKSIAGLFFLPAYFLFALYDRKLLSVLSHKAFYLAMLTVIVMVGAYYTISEWSHPGFLKLVWEEELIPRYTNTSETNAFNESPDPFFYSSLVWNWYFKFFSWMLPVALGLIFLVNKDQSLRRFFVLVLITILSFLVIISNGTINAWYTVPLFPLLAMITGIGLALAIQLLFRILKVETKFWRISLTCILSLLIFYQPYRFIVEKIYVQEIGQAYQYGAFMEKLREHDPQIDSFFVYYGKGNSSYQFYEKVYNTIYHYDIRSCMIDKGKLDDCARQPQIGDLVMVCYDNIFNSIQLLYEYKEIRNFNGCHFLEIKGRKSSTD